MQRLTEDHGVCLTSCLDFWDDDLVLQAFNRNLILAPQIYGNPWLLRDDEFPKLARIFNLHRRYNSILTAALVLPEESCGPHAVSRGDGRTRLITLRNLTWQPKTYQIKLDPSIGLETKDSYEVRQHHPVERILGTFKAGETVPVEVLPYRACLIKVAAVVDELGIQGTAWQVVREVSNKPLEIDLLGMPGAKAEISLAGPASSFKSATIDGADASGLIKGDSRRVAFAGKPIADPWHCLLGRLEEVPPPATMEPAAEAMFFATDNNCLEVRALQRSGPTTFAAVRNARDAFFGDAVFKRLGTWDRFAFDGDPETAFKVREYTGAHGPGVLRLRLPEATVAEKITLAGIESGYVPARASVSTNLVDWHGVGVVAEGGGVVLGTGDFRPFRYLRLDPAPRRIGEITAVGSSGVLNTTQWRASNLFPASGSMRALRAWRGDFPAMELPETGYLCVAVPGAYGPEGAFAVLQCGEDWIGAEDRSPTYAFNNWEHIASPHGGHYTYYFRPNPSLRGRPFTVHVFGSGPKTAEIGVPEVWRTAYPQPLVRRRLVLAR